MLYDLYTYINTFINTPFRACKRIVCKAASTTEIPVHKKKI